VVIEILEGTAADLPVVEGLLLQAGLPLDGLRKSQRLMVARIDGRIVGSAALEAYENGVLLRSVVVAEELRNSRIGQRLTSAALAAASAMGHRMAYLLTTTADGFFGRFGFVAIDRAEVPADVKQSVEFTSACPASALVMRAARAVKARKGGFGRKPGNDRRVTPRSPCHSCSPAVPPFLPFTRLQHSHPIEVASQSSCAVGVEHEADHLITR
jgi:amino-acid N-acetyltransferase